MVIGGVIKILELCLSDILMEFYATTQIAVFTGVLNVALNGLGIDQ